jgi:hypothetical protein
MYANSMPVRNYETILPLYPAGERQSDVPPGLGERSGAVLASDGASRCVCHNGTGHRFTAACMVGGHAWTPFPAHRVSRKMCHLFVWATIIRLIEVYDYAFPE